MASDQSMYFSKSSVSWLAGSMICVARGARRSRATTYGGVPFGVHLGLSVDVQFVVDARLSMRNGQGPSGESTAAVRKPVVVSPAPDRSASFRVATSRTRMRVAPSPYCSRKADRPSGENVMNPYVV